MCIGGTSREIKTCLVMLKSLFTLHIMDNLALMLLPKYERFDDKFSC